MYINDTSSCSFYKNDFVNKVHRKSLISKQRIIEKNYAEDKDFYSISASHNGYQKKFGCIHKRSIKISKKSDVIFCNDELKKTKNYSGSLNYFIRFHIYPNTKVVKTMSRNSVLLSLSNGEGWSLVSETNNLEIEKNIFLGNKNKIMNNECVFITGIIDKKIFSIKWKIERVS